MKEYIKLCSKKEREILSLKYTKDTPIDVIKNFLGNAFVRCAYGEIEIKISDLKNKIPNANIIFFVILDYFLFYNFYPISISVIKQFLFN